MKAVVCTKLGEPNLLEIKEVDIEKALEIINAKKETKQKIKKKKK